MTEILPIKKIFGGATRARFTAVASAFTCLIAVVTSAGAAQLKEARVTQVVNDVKLLLQQAAPRPAVVSDLVRTGSAVRTGTQSRSELTFADLTITRLGANTIFSFNQGTREMNLIDGAILFQVPKGKGGATITTAGVTVSITGTTGIGEFHPATSSNPLFSKWLCLEGTFRLILPNGQVIELGPGKMVTTDGKSFSKVVDFDIGALVKSSLFFIGFDTPLASLDLIALEEQNQLDLRLASGLVDTTTQNPLDPTRIVNVINQAIVAEEAQASPSPSVSPTPPPTPSKFGTPSVITSPDPYLITSGTTISTDPAITTNGVMDFGKIYRGPEDDGAFSLWAFGSTSAVDTALDFDTHFNNAGHVPAAAFKFTSLVLAGNPTIDLSNSGVTNLALISVGDITSGLPGGTLTFSGLDALLLASQDASINLGSEITFQDIPTLFFYARGTNGDLTLASPIVGTTDLFLYAGRNITFNAGTDLILGGQFSARSVGGNISVSESGNVSVGGSLSVTTDASNVQNGANIFVSSGGNMLIGGSFALTVFAGDDSTTGTGGNIDVHSGGSLTAGNLNFTSRYDPSLGVTDGANVSLNVAGDLTTTAGGIILRHSTPVGSTTATLVDGGNLSLMVGGNLTTAPGAGLTLDIINTSGSNVLNGANIFASIGGDLTAASVTLRSSNNGDGSTGTGSNLTLEVGGGINASNFSAELNNSSGGHIGTGGNINVSIGGDLTTTGTAGDFALVVRNTNGLIDNGGNIALAVDGGVSTQGQLSLLVENYDFTANPAGHIGDGGNISLTTGGNLTADSMSVAINNRGGGAIDSGVSLVLNIGGALTTLHDGPDFIEIPNSLSLAISSRFDDQSGNTAGSSIGGDATLLFHSDSASIGGHLAVAISDRGGTIDGNALLNFSVTHDITVQSDAAWQILNDSGTTMNAASPIGGTIHGSANLLLSAANLTVTAGSLDVSILNKNGGVVGSGGTIDSDANITFTLSGNLTTQQAAIFRIRNDLQPGGTTGGTIGGDATVNVTAANISAGVDSFGNSLESSINNRMGNIGGNAIANVDVTNNITAQGPAVFEIFNVGGTIDGNGMVSVSAANISAGSFLAQIENSNGGMIGGAANVAVNIDNNVTTPNGILLQILNGSSGHIVTGANVLYSVGGSTSTTDLTEYIDNSNGGVIGNGGNITLHTVGPVMLDGALGLEVDNFNGGTINTGANVTAHFVGDVTDTVGDFHSLNFYVINGSGFFTPTATGGTIGTGGNINVTFDGNASTTGTSTTGSIAAEIFNGAGGSIATGGNISMTVGGNLTVGPLFLITENQGGNLGTGGNMTLDVSGDITTQGDANFLIFNNDNGNGSGPGTIGSDATISVSAANISTGGTFLDAEIDNYSGGTIGGNAIINFAALGNVHAQGTAFLQIVNSSGGHIGGNAILDVSTGGDFSATGDLFARIYNDNGGGFIGGDARINFSANTISTGGSDPFPLAIQNLNGGHIVGDADIELIASGGITANSFATTIDNSIGGMIDSNALINVSVGNTNLQGGAIFAIFNQGGGSIGGDATINMNVSGNATVTNDATVAIYGSDGAVGGAGININGGNYNVGGTFLSYIDGNGTITFNNVNAHADVLKAGVFGSNGTLTIGGGTLSADSTLELYAPGSNGQLNFVSNVTLGGGGAKILAANSVTIFNSVVVTIGGPNAADVYTNNANYTGFGGNNSTTGTFAGAGANDPQPLANAPPFGPASPRLRSVTSGGITTRERRTGSTINITSSDQLLSLLDGADRGPAGRITIPASRSTSNSRNSGRIDAANRLNVADRLNADRRAGYIRTASSLLGARRLQPQ